jgi:hypothetical protein
MGKWFLRGLGSAVLLLGLAAPLMAVACDSGVDEAPAKVQAKKKR